MGVNKVAAIAGALCTFREAGSCAVKSWGALREGISDAELVVPSVVLLLVARKGEIANADLISSHPWEAVESSIPSESSSIDHQEHGLQSAQEIVETKITTNKQLRDGFLRRTKKE